MSEHEDTRLVEAMEELRGEIKVWMDRKPFIQGAEVSITAETSQQTATLRGNLTRVPQERNQANE